MEKRLERRLPLPRHTQRAQFHNQSEGPLRDQELQRHPSEHRQHQHHREQLDELRPPDEPWLLTDSSDQIFNETQQPQLEATLTSCTQSFSITAYPKSLQEHAKQKDQFRRQPGQTQSMARPDVESVAAFSLPEVPTTNSKRPVLSGQKKSVGDSALAIAVEEIDGPGDAWIPNMKKESISFLPLQTDASAKNAMVDEVALIENDLNDSTSLQSPSSEECPVATNQLADAFIKNQIPSKRKRRLTGQEHASKIQRNEAKWLEHLEDLREYYQVNGDCMVPRGYPLNTRLASWVAEQRYVAKASFHRPETWLTFGKLLSQHRKQFKLLKDGKQTSITKERIDFLNAINFAWNAQEAVWDRHVQNLKAFREKYGHCHVPLNHSECPTLGLWVKEQRRHYSLMKQGKSSHMTEERSRALNDLGFCWDTHEASWLERLWQLALYKQKNGDCMVPVGWSENPKLSSWVHHQRRQYRRWVIGKPSHINSSRVKILEDMGFCWNGQERANHEDENDVVDGEND